MIIRLTNISPLELDSLMIGEKISNVLLDKYREMNNGEPAEDLAYAIRKLRVRELWVHKAGEDIAIVTEAEDWNDITMLRE